MSDLWLREISVSDFRSIQRLELPVSRLTAFVGNNDSGKSNILRALNLFFNNETNPGVPLAFGTDYNFHSSAPAQRAKEIIVRLEFGLPPAYRNTNGDLMIWEKRWRASGLHSSKYWGVRLSTSTRGNEKRETVQIPGRSNAHSLMSRVQFEYIPAVRDRLFFDSMRARIYRTIAEVASTTFHESSGEFEHSINDHLSDLIQDIDRNLGLATSLRLPRDLSPIFERLDFQSGETNVSLENRGDGIKVRHIPLMLDFVATKVRSLQVQGAMPYTFIWGYEEPENNLEIKSSIALADSLARYVSEGKYQILFTTHSPVFYNAAEDLPATRAVVHFVTKPTEESGSVVVNRPDDLDAQMGTMLLFAPHVRRFEEEVRKLESSLEQARALEADERPKLFFEGANDRDFFARIIRAHSPDRINSLALLTKPAGAGVNYVVDMLYSWSTIRKHDQELPRSAGVLDRDEEGRRAYKYWLERNVPPENARCFRVPVPPHLHEAQARGFKVPVTLEALYDADAWAYAEQQGWLENRNLGEFLHGCPEVDDLFRSNQTIEEYINAPWSVYVSKQVRVGRKSQFVRYWVTRNDQVIQQRFGFLNDFIDSLLNYLTPPQAVPQAIAPGAEPAAQDANDVGG